MPQRAVSEEFGAARDVGYGAMSVSYRVSLFSGPWFKSATPDA